MMSFVKPKLRTPMECPESADNISMGLSNDEEDDPVLHLGDIGKEIWADTDADQYVRDLRANWYGAQLELDFGEEPH